MLYCGTFLSKQIKNSINLDMVKIIKLKFYCPFKATIKAENLQNYAVFKTI